MAITQYRVQFVKNFLSFNGGEIAFFDSVTAGRLVSSGQATAIDALPGIVAGPAYGQAIPDYIDDGGLPAATSAADSAVLGAEAGLLAGC